MAVGTYNNYDLIIEDLNTSQSKIPVTFYVKAPNQTFCEQLLTDGNLTVPFCKYSAHNYSFFVIMTVHGSLNENVSRINDILDNLTSEFLKFGYVTCDYL